VLRVSGTTGGGTAVDRTPLGEWYIVTAVRDLAAALILLALGGGLAYSSAAGITCSNDGSTYALTRALAENGSPQIDQFESFTEGIDLAVHGGHVYSDRAPGVAFLAVPLDRIGRAIGHTPSFPRSKHDDGAPQIPFILLLPALSAGLATAMTFLLGRRLGAGIVASVVAAIAVAAGTLVWRDGSLLYRHVPAAAFLAVATWLALGLDARETSATPIHYDLARGAGVGMLIGLAALCDQPAALAVVPVAMFAVLRLVRGPHALRRIGLLAAGTIVGLIPPTLAQLAYNRACFGDAFANAYQFSATAHFYGSAGTAFSTPLAKGVHTLLFGKPGADPPFGSVGRLSPILFLAPVGLAVLVARRQLAAAWLVGATATVVFFLVAKHATFDGGGDQDYRYLVSVIPLLAAPIALALDVALKRRWPLRIAGLAVVLPLLFLSIVRSAGHLRLQYAHKALPGHPLFTNLVNLPKWLATCVLVAALVVGASLLGPVLRRSLGKSQPKVVKTAAS
jgi:hypothetical protein